LQRVHGNVSLHPKSLEEASGRNLGNVPPAAAVVPLPHSIVCEQLHIVLPFHQTSVSLKLHCRFVDPARHGAGNVFLCNRAQTE